jgi:DNA invertase Pin-like site-specific DNA recombinase
MRVIAYLRVSTDLQAEQGLGLDVQRKGIRGWARANGHQIVAWHSDEGVSGSNGIETRQALLDALNDLEDRKAKGLVVYRLDRLARKLTVQEATLARVWALGCSVYSVDLGEVPHDDPDDPMRTALRQMVGVFAQLERGMIAARLRAGRRLKAERGGYAGGAPGFGVRAEGRELVQDEREQQVIARISELHQAGQSSRAIAPALNAEAMLSKRGGSWSSATVARVVRSLNS